MRMNQGPTLWGNVEISPDTDELFAVLGKSLVNMAINSVQANGVFHLALSGGSTPEPFYTRLVSDPDFRLIPWDKTHVWLVDERRVPLDHEKSNYRMIRETLLDHVPMRERNKHPVPVDEADPGAAYERELLSHFEGRPEPAIDFLLLGMGDDGHTASLFPGSGGLAEKERFVVNNEGPGVVPPPRVTMTYRLINDARHVGVLCVGPKKLATLTKVDQQMRDAGPDPVTLPITGIRPRRGRLVWYLDQAAAGADFRIPLD
jgi:6-phosphogluconolactonase